MAKDTFYNSAQVDSRLQKNLEDSTMVVQKALTIDEVANIRRIWKSYYPVLP